MPSEKHKIVIFSKEASPRLRYVLKHIFSQFWDTDLHLVHQHRNVEGVAIAYGAFEHESENLIRVPKSSLLFESEIRMQELSTELVSGYPVAFSVPEGPMEYDMRFDMLAFVFYHLSRYEEYLPGKLDEHGRYQSSNGWSSQNGCLDKPIVDLVILQLGDIIMRKFGIRLKQNTDFQIIPSFDIDMPYAYKYKGYKAYAGMIRDVISGNFGSVQDRVKYWMKGIDPFDQFNAINKLCAGFENSYCFLLHNWDPPYDLNHIITKPIWQKIVSELASLNHIGIHPSYNSDHAITKLQLEVKNLENISNQKIHRSRQHFLKLKFPDTYQMLLQIGIHEDHSMIYPDQIGFRAGTAHTFFWYDLHQEKETVLKVFPYVVMDATLRYYMQFTPEQAIDSVNQLKYEASRVKGNFGCIWHNSSMSRAYGWGNWQKVMRACLNTSVFPNR